MKLNYYILLVVSFLLVSCGTENRVYKVEYNYSTKTPKFLNQQKSAAGVISYNEIPADKAIVKEGSNVQIEITDYNPIVHEFTVQKAADVLFFVNSSNQSSVLNNFIGISPPISAPAPIHPVGNDPVCRLIDKIKNDELTLLDEMTSFNNYYSAVRNLNGLIDLYKKKQTFNQNYFYCEIDNAVFNIEANYLAPDNTNSVTVCNNSTYAYISGAHADNIALGRDAYVKKIQADISSITTDIAKVSTTIPPICGSVQLSPTVTQSLKDATTLLNDISSKASSNIDQIVNNLKAMSSLNFTTRSGMFKVKETDEFVLNLSVKDNSNSSTTVYPLADLPVYKTIKIDYSVGSFYSWLYDESFTKTVTTTTDSSGNPPVTTNHFELHKFDAGGSSFGAMGYINFHTQFSSDFNFGASLGAGLRFNQSTKFVFAPTVSLFIGKYQRLIIHLGAAFSQVDRVYSKYGEDTFTDADYSPETKSVIRSSLLLGISWNLSSTK